MNTRCSRGDFPSFPLRSPADARTLAGWALRALRLMPTSPLQRLSVRCCSALRQGLARLATWLRARPRWAAWVFPSEAESAAARYREFNGRTFASFFEQERMLADQPRMAFYHAAIARHLRPGARVIDLGTGTGILAAFAARAGAAQVYAIDHSSILEHARALAAHNRLERVEFLATHSRDLRLAAPVDAILHEQMGDCLFDEDMLANVAELRDRLLRPGGLILPSRFEFFCEPVKVRDQRRVPFIWELNVGGYDYSCLDRDRPDEPEYYRFAGTDPSVVEYYVGTPAPALTFDLHTASETTVPRELQFTRTVTRASRVDALAVFFRARVDDDLVLDTAPLNPGRPPHWGYRLLRLPAVTYAAGDTLALTLRAQRWAEPDTWRWTCRAATTG